MYSTAASLKGNFMPIVVTNIRSGLSETPEDIVHKAMKQLKVASGEVVSAAVSKTSVDARKGRVSFVSSVVVRLAGGEKEAAGRVPSSNVIYREDETLVLDHGSRREGKPVVVVGFGPAGMFAALLLSEQGYRVIVLERGQDVDARTAAVGRFWKKGVLDVDSNVQFGEGGAGTFSDGKLTTRIGDARCSYVLSCFVEFGAPEEILTKAKPHVGTDHLKKVVKNMRQRVLKNGGEIRFSTKLERVYTTPQGPVACLAGGGEIPAAAVVLAVGHSARGVFERLCKDDYNISPKPFSVGVRVEHLQDEIDKALYHDLAAHPLLPKGEYQLSHRSGGEAVYTFCMCPGGFVVPAASEAGGVVVNGMSEFSRSQKNANAALVVAVDPVCFGSGPMAGVAFQRELEHKAFAMGKEQYRAPAATAGRFLVGKTGYAFGRVEPSYSLGVEPADFDRVFPHNVNRMLREGLERFGRKLPGFDADDVVLTGVETRTSSPVRIERDAETLQAVGRAGVYPCGEGAGYAGGIMSAAVDGIRVAQAVMKEFAPQL